MAKKRGHAAGSPEPPTSPLRAALAPPPPTLSPDEVIVNNANVTEMKVACDDALKRYIGRPDTSFSAVNTHTDVRLALGWGSVLVAGLTAFYGYKVDFETSKPVMWIGLSLCVITALFLACSRTLTSDDMITRYILLTSAQALYVWLVEGNTIFIGKRKTYAKRVESERIRVDSKSIAPAYSRLRAFVKPSPAAAPSYQLSMSYVRLTNAGKTLIHKVRYNPSSFCVRHSRAHIDSVFPSLHRERSKPRPHLQSSSIQMESSIPQSSKHGLPLECPASWVAPLSQTLYHCFESITRLFFLSRKPAHSAGPTLNASVSAVRSVVTCSC